MAGLSPKSSPLMTRGIAILLVGLWLQTLIVGPLHHGDVFCGIPTQVEIEHREKCHHLNDPRWLHLCPTAGLIHRAETCLACQWERCSYRGETSFSLPTRDFYLESLRPFCSFSTLSSSSKGFASRAPPLILS